MFGLPIDNIITEEDIGLPKKENKNKISVDLWSLTKTKYHLNSRQIEMAKKRGMNPKEIGGLISTKSEPWKKPLGQFIESCYYKRFKEMLQLWC